MDNKLGAVLLVEDDTSIRRGLRATLTAMQFEIGEASTGEEALLRLRMVDYDAVLMDLNMPGMGGVEACRRIRKEFPQISILVVTVREGQEDKVEALDAGADDYITKPFQLQELAARIRAAIRRRHTPLVQTQKPMHIGAIELDPARRRVRKNGQEVNLTPTEFDLLCLLMINARHPVPHAKLLTSVWGPEYADQRDYLRTFVLQLRRKLEDDPSQPAYLTTVNYLGYRFSDPTEE